MRRRIALLLAAVAATALAVASACNPIFGIVSRTEGSTWCEETAQANSAYCDDFDRVPSSTTSQETPQRVGGSFEITDAAAHSPPNSLEVKSLAAKAGSGALVSILANFGPTVAPGSPLTPLHCSVDIRSAEVAAAMKVTTVGLAAVGAQTLTKTGGSGPPTFVFISFGPDGGTASVASVNSTSGTAEPIGNPCPLFGGDFQTEWITLGVSMRTLTGLEAGSFHPCTVGVVDAGADASRADDKPAYVVIVQLGAFQNAVLVPDERFIGQPFFAYGISILDAPPSLTLYFDNAVCLAGEGGVTLP